MGLLNDRVTTGNSPAMEPEMIRRAKERKRIQLRHGSKVANRSSPEWPQMLVDYALNERKKMHRYWRWVDDNLNLHELIRSQNLEEFREVSKGRLYNYVYTILSMIYNMRPKPQVRGLGGVEMDERARLLGDILFRSWSEDYRMNRETKHIIIDAASKGIGIGMSIYSLEETPKNSAWNPERQKKQAEKEARDEAQDPLLRAGGDDIMQEVAERIVRFPPDEQKITWEGDERLLQGEVNQVRIAPEDYFIDPQAAHKDDARFEGRLVIADLESVKSNALFDEDARSKVRESRAEDFEKMGMPWAMDKECPYPMVVLADLWERVPNEGMRNTWHPINQDVLLYEQWDYLWTGSPFRILVWNDDGDRIYPTPDIAQFHSEVLAEREVLTAHIDRVRHEEPTEYIDSRSGLNKDNFHTALQSDAHGKRVFTTPEEGFRLQDMFYTTVLPSQTGESLTTLQFLENSFRTSSGMGPNQFGQVMKSETSATESANIAQSTKARMVHKRVAVEEFIAGWSYDRGALYAQFKNGDIDWALTLLEPEKATQWAEINWTPGMVQRGMRVLIQSGSLQPTDEATQLNNLMTYLSIVAQYPAMFANTNIPAIQAEIERLLGFEGRFLLEDDPQKAARAMVEETLARSQGNGSETGSPARGPATAGGEAAARQARGGE